MSMKEKRLIDVINDAIRATLEKLGGPLPCKVVAVYPESVDLQPSVNLTIAGRDIEFPVLKNVPVFTMYGGESYEAMPISVGDYALAIVCARSFDRWYIGQDGLAPLEDRKFDYSDCFAFVGINPLAKNIPIPSVITRRGDCDMEGDYVHRGNYNQTGNYQIAGNITQENPSGTSQAEFKNSTINLDNQSDIIIRGVSLWDFITTHTHGGVQPGGGNTGVPN